jgi:hypothetical protein
MGKQMSYEGGCHCGAVRFRIAVTPAEQVVSDCNCSICRKKGFLHLILPLERFTLLYGADSLTTYTFNTEVAKHTFCKVCGIHSFYTPRSHPDKIDVNIRCLDENILAQFRVEPFDGVNWEKTVHQLQIDEERSDLMPPA